MLEPPKSSEEAPLALQPKEDKSAVAAEPPKADDNLNSTELAGTAANGTDEEDSAPAKAENTVQDAVQSVKDTVQSVVGGEQEEAAPKEPVMTGALPSEPEPAENAAAPAPDAGFPIGEHKDDSAPAEKPAAETNGSETKDAAASAEDAVVGEKHKAEEALATNGDAKKAKVTTGNGEARKPGRPSKKDKKPQPTPQQANGKTVRKTRSQGPVEV